MSRQVVAKASEVAPGTSKMVTVAGREIGIFNLDGAYFALANRRLSHGCVRVQNPRQLGSLLMGIAEDDISKAINTGVTNRRNLPEPIAVFIVYQTAFIDPDGTLEFRRDFYQRDAAIAQRLSATPQVPVAARGTPNQRGG